MSHAFVKLTWYLKSRLSYKLHSMSMLDNAHPQYPFKNQQPRLTIIDEKFSFGLKQILTMIHSTADSSIKEACESPPVI